MKDITIEQYCDGWTVEVDMILMSVKENIKELLSSGYTTREVAWMLDIPFQIVLKVETEYRIQ